MPKLYLLLGSNKGSRVDYLFAAKSMLEIELDSCVAISSIYETAAWGNKQQAAFLNQCLAFETHLLPQEILTIIKNIELRCGRTVSERWGEREIDIDILLHGDLIYESDNLSIPHIHLHERKFALLPLYEIADYALHPIFKKNILQLLGECNDGLEVAIYNAE
jgi:2-amino-4-hydroxy-6-hydroxymethyldihydropteridine diphosphokinase